MSGAEAFKMTKQSIPDFVKVYFDSPTEENGQYKCKVCKIGRRKSGTSWQNLQSHLNDKHSDWKIELQNVLKGGTLAKYVDIEGIFVVINLDRDQLL